VRSASVKRSKPALARLLRRKATSAESHFWKHVRNRQLEGAKFRRQWPVGKFIVDFRCSELRLVVEIDGGQHQGNCADVVRTLELERSGYRVVRFWNNEILANIEGVIEELRRLLPKEPLTPNPLP